MSNNHSDDEESGEEMEVSSPENAGTESESESESESDSEPEPEPGQQPKKPPVAVPKKPQPQDSFSSTEEESDSDSEPESDPETLKPNPVVKPIDDPKKTSPKPRSKPDATTKLTYPKKSTAVAVSGAKRPVDDGEAKESKKSKKKQVKEIETPVSKTPTEDVKRQLFQRLWSEDDEIAILKGMIEYRSKKKADPVADLSAFHEFIKKSLHVDVAKTQLQDKIRRLKKKYENNAGKEKKGKERSFTKPHEQKAYELSKKIWGKEKSDNKGEFEIVEVENVAGSKEKGDSGGKDNGVLVLVKEEKQSLEMEKNVEVAPNLGLVSCRERVAALEMWLEENSGLLSMEKKNEMKEKWTSLKLAEVDSFFRRVKLIDEQGELVREAMRAYGIEI
ncbi:unnamed protein product [Withania somnifera]